MAPNFKLHYFNIKGFGEGSRLLFAAAGVEYEDKRWEFSTWPDFKPKTPFGHMPVLEVDGHMIPESRAIERFLAKKFGLYGENEMEQALVDAYADTLMDMFFPVKLIHMEKDEAKKAELKKEYVEKTLPEAFAKLEKVTGDSGYMVGNKLTWADTAFFHFLDITKPVGVDISSIEGYPKLAKVVANVKSNPGIAAWLEKRPKSDR